MPNDELFLMDDIELEAAAAFGGQAITINGVPIYITCYNCRVQVFFKATSNEADLDWLVARATCERCNYPLFLDGA